MKDMEKRVNVRIEFTYLKVKNKNAERNSSFFIALMIGVERTFHEFRNI